MASWDLFLTLRCQFGGVPDATSRKSHNGGVSSPMRCSNAVILDRGGDPAILTGSSLRILLTSLFELDLHSVGGQVEAQSHSRGLKFHDDPVLILQIRCRSASTYRQPRCHRDVIACEILQALQVVDVTIRRDIGCSHVDDR
jgi:hypothetical protein